MTSSTSLTSRSSRTDQLLAAVREEIERRRVELDAPDAQAGARLRSLTLVVEMDTRTGLPFRVTYAPQMQRTLGAGPG